MLIYFKLQVVSKTRKGVTGNGVTRNRVTGYIYIFFVLFFFFDFLIIFLYLFNFFFFKFNFIIFLKKCEHYYSCLVGFFPPFGQSYRISGDTFIRGRTFSRFHEVGHGAER